MMGRQSYGDESKRKHRPHSKHYVEDEFGKGSSTRNWKEAENSAETKKVSAKDSEDQGPEEDYSSEQDAEKNLQ